MLKTAFAMYVCQCVSASRSGIVSHNKYENYGISVMRINNRHSFSIFVVTHLMLTIIIFHRFVISNLLRNLHIKQSYSMERFPSIFENILRKKLQQNTYIKLMDALCNLLKNFSQI